MSEETGELRFWYYAGMNDCPHLGCSDQVPCCPQCGIAKLDFNDGVYCQFCDQEEEDGRSEPAWHRESTDEEEHCI